MTWGEHTTTTTPWNMVLSPHDGDYAYMKMVTSIEGCPYDITIEVKLSAKQLLDMHLPSFQNIVFALSGCEYEMDAAQLMWDRILTVKTVLMSQPVQDFTLEDWEKHLPFLFDGKPPEEDEEAMQARRDTWT